MEEQKKQFGRLLIISIVAALAGLLFGFDVAIITGAGPYFTETFELNSLQEGWAYSSLLFGCIFGSIIAGRLSDTYGRKIILFIVAVLFAITSVGSGLATGLAWLATARFIGGLAVGAASAIAPVYISEIAPPSKRGSLVSMYQLFIVTGILISYLINYLLSGTGENNWRWMFITGAIPSILFFILLFFIPESPRYLCRKGKKERAFEVLAQVGGELVARKQLSDIENTLHNENVSFRELLNPSLKKVLLIGLMLAILVQMSGINVVIDYAPKIFTKAGWKLDTGLFATFGIGLVNFIFTWVSILLIDKYGRRILYIWGSAGMSISLAGLTIAGFTGHFEGLVVLLLIILFIASFASSIGPVFWTYISEIFPNKIRGTAMTVPVFTQWIFNALAVLVFPVMMNQLQIGITFAIILVFALLQLLLAIKSMPETKGKSLEEIEELWKKNGV
jgi:SP family arabinose:H+ symporter-like MFS transporter